MMREPPAEEVASLKEPSGAVTMRGDIEERGRLPGLTGGRSEAWKSDENTREKKIEEGTN